MKKPVIATPEVTNYILRRFNLHADKKLIAAAAELAPGEPVLEVGPGIGTLTQALAETGADVTAVELDKRLLPVLEKTLEGYENVRVINADVLELDVNSAMGGKSFKVAANLPYYITTPIIFALLEKKLPLERMVIMVQKEVAERITAAPGGKDYGALSVAMQYYTEPEIAFIVLPSSFIPRPSVDSAVVVCKNRTVPPVEICDEKLFFRVVKAAFSLRRKMLSNALKNMGITSQQAQEWLNLAGIDPKRRGETLSLQDFANLTNTFEKIK